MAEKKKEAASSADRTGKSSSLGDEIGKEFLSSWKSMSVGDDDMMDFNFGSVTKGKNETFQFGKLDMDFSLNEKFGKIESFKVDLPDLDFSSPSKGNARSTEKCETSASKHTEAREERFSFSFDFNKLDNFDVDSSMKKEEKKDKSEDNIQADLNKDNDAAEGRTSTAFMPSDNLISGNNEPSVLASTKTLERKAISSRTERIGELKFPMKKEEKKSKTDGNIEVDLYDDKDVAEERTKFGFRPSDSLISEKNESSIPSSTKASEKKEMPPHTERISELKFPLKKKVPDELDDPISGSPTNYVAVPKGIKQVEEFLRDQASSPKPDIAKTVHGLPHEGPSRALNEGLSSAAPAKGNSETTTKVPLARDEQLSEGDATTSQRRRGNEVTKNQFSLHRSEKMLSDSKTNFPTMLSVNKSNLSTKPVRRNVFEKKDKQDLEHRDETEDGKTDPAHPMRRLSASLSLKRKMPEAKCPVLNQPKRLMELPKENSSKPKEDLKRVIAEENPPAKNLPFDCSSSASVVPCETCVVFDNDETVTKAEACAKELEDICNMLRKKHDEAKDLVVRAVVHNNNLLMLDHPMYREKLGSVHKFAAQLATKNLLA